MLCLDNNKEIMELFEEADKAKTDLLGLQMYGVLWKISDLELELKRAHYEEIKKEILDRGLWFEFMYYCDRGRYHVHPDANLGDGLTYVYDRKVFYLNGSYISHERAYDILSENGKLDSYDVYKKLVLMDGAYVRPIERVFGLEY